MNIAGKQIMQFSATNEATAGMFKQLIKMMMKQTGKEAT